MQPTDINIGLNSYSIVRKLGEGDDALVYLVEDNQGDKYALKLILPVSEDEGARRLNKKIYGEIRKISHPNMVAVYDIGRIMTASDDYQQLLRLIERDRYLNALREPLLRHVDIVYVLMEYIEGYDLHERSLTEDETLSLMTDLLSAIRVLQLHNIVHNDISDYNIMYDKDTACYKLLDFGLAKFIGNEQQKIDEMIRANKVVIRCRFYPRPTADIEDGNIISYTLPETSAINKYVNHMNKNKNPIELPSTVS